MPDFTMRLAGKTVAVSSLHDDVRLLCRDYVIDGACGGADAVTCFDGRKGAADAGIPSSGAGASVGAFPDLRVRVDQAAIDAERARDPKGFWSDGYLETLAVYRRIAEDFPRRGILLMHGAAVSYAGRAYLFCAPSGTGKTTHVRLWRRFLGLEAQVVNGDKPLVRREADGRFSVCGTPWAGKEGWQANVSVPLAGICLLARAAENTIVRVDGAAALERVLEATYLPADAAAAAATLGLLDALLAAVPAYRLCCDRSESALRCSFEGLTGLNYHECKARPGARKG